mmetsp:Transcript_17535/g.53472  ORF Transcript_17535/g.53472 Transcript_17535/m.53472 type:complete len:341 (+) Transcript_17535:1126-2148(+)
MSWYFLGSNQMRGASAKSTFGSDSARTRPLKSHRAPSRKRPYAKTPVSGGFVRLPAGIISKRKPMASMGMVRARARFCLVAVRNAAWKKKALNQKVAGGSRSSHCRKKASLASRSFTYDAMGLNDGYDLLFHATGIVPTTSESPSFSSSADMTTSPLTARISDASDAFTRSVSRLNLLSSPHSTVFIDSAQSTGYRTNAASKSKVSFWNFCRMSVAVAVIAASFDDDPPEPDPPPSVSRIAENSDAVSCVLFVMFAFSCNPKISGAATSGNSSTTLRNSSCCVSSGPSSPSPLRRRRVAGTAYVPLADSALPVRRFSGAKNRSKIEFSVILSCPSVTRPP